MHPKYLPSLKSKDYLERIRNQSCLICGSGPTVDPHHAWHARHIDFFSLPLCRECHSRRHNSGVKTFWDEENMVVEHEVIRFLLDYIRRSHEEETKES